MKELLTVLPLAAALVACQTASIEQLSYGSKLDRIRVAAPVDPAAGTPVGQARSAQASTLRAEARALRSRLAVEPDRVQRIAILRQLEELGDTLRRLDAGGPLSFDPQPGADGAGPG